MAEASPRRPDIANLVFVTEEERGGYRRSLHSPAVLLYTFWLVRCCFLGSTLISSASMVSPEHRKQVSEACLRMGYVPVGMEQWPAEDADAETVRLRDVDRANLFMGIYAFRYGWVPPGHTVPTTELEHRRAVEPNKPRLLFFIDENHTFHPRLMEKGEGGAKLEAFSGSRPNRRGQLAGGYPNTHRIRPRTRRCQKSLC